MKRRFAKPVVVVLAFGVLALVLSACAFFKPESLTLSQPGGIGSARVHFALCSINPSEEDFCGPTTSSSEGEYQYLVGIAVPSGSVPPATITATPVKGGGPSIVFTRNEEVTAEMTAASASFRKAIEEGEFESPSEKEAIEAIFGKAWPPSGMQGFGYLSPAENETEGPEREWTLDPDFGLPAPADGTPFVGPFKAAVAYGIRNVEGGTSASSPVHCERFESEEGETICTGSLDVAEVGTNDLKISTPKPTTALVGGKASLKFGLNLGSTTTSPPTFALAGTTTVPHGSVTIPSGASYVPGPVATDTHRATPIASTVEVKVPKGTKPGTYQVTFIATVPGGGSVSQVAQLKVKKPMLQLGKVKLNEGKGTATLFAKVSAAGTLSVSGKGVAPAKAKAKGPKQLKLTIRAKGMAKGLLTETGSAKLKLKVTFKPTSGISVKKTKALVLKLS
jgi:hypothetical protein